MNDYIPGGYVLLPRNILESEIWRKPPAYLKAFIYILLKANHSDCLFERGSNFFNFSNSSLPWITKNQVYDFLRWGKSQPVQILTTQKTTRGVVVKINDYNKYQNPSNYEFQHEFQDISNTTPKPFQNNSNTINKNEIIKEEKNICISPKRYKTDLKEEAIKCYKI